MATSSAIKLIASIFGASSICVCPVSRLIAPWMFRRWRPVVCSIPMATSFGAQHPVGRA